MSITEHAARYGARRVRDWLVMADTGAIALPNFQRSYVWENQRIADYLMALFENRPTGIFLVLESQDSPKFISRTLKGVDEDRTAQELVLDGQQRLTSLWNALKGKTNYRFYARVEDLKSRKMNVQEVVFYSERSTRGRALHNPETAYREDLVPIDILYDDADAEDDGSGQDPDEPGKIWDWCEEACDEGAVKRRLERAIQRRLSARQLLDRELQYCALPAETDSNVAIDIFVETNKSSATIKRFDIAVAIAQGDYEEDLRDRIASFYRENSVMAHYFSHDEEKMIPEIGEWLLKVACLKVKNDKSESGVPPKEQNYQEALQSLFQDGRQRGTERLNKLQGDLAAALEFAAQCGGTTRRTLPAWPPVHVIAALQDDLRAIRKPAWKGTADKLVSAYLWRAFLTDRYEAQANNRLFEDFVDLRGCLDQIKNMGCYDSLPRIFDNDNHPTPTSDDLVKPLQWIGRSGRLGRAIAAIAMQRTPLDWVIGKKLNADAVRELEDKRKLERHHVFPREFLKAHVEPTEIDHGLNGVLLSKEANLALSKKDPTLSLDKILRDTQGLSKAELRKRVESHLVPYDALVSKSRGTLKDRYENFITQRAKLVAVEIAGLVKP